MIGICDDCKEEKDPIFQIAFSWICEECYAELIRIIRDRETRVSRGKKND